MADVLFKSQNYQRKLAQRLKARRALLTSRHALRAVPHALRAVPDASLPIERSTSFWTERTQHALRRARTMQPSLPGPMKATELSPSRRAERGLSRWMRARRIHINNMNARLGIYYLDAEELSDEYPDSTWLSDQNDPDNFLRIPEFGVTPQSVDFQGFAFPIVHPAMGNRDDADSIRTMLRTARKKIRAAFTTQSAMMDKAREAYDLDPSQWTPLHRSAFAFRLLEVAIEGAVQGSTAKHQFASLAQAGSILAAWLGDDSDALAKMRRFQDAGNIGGLRSAKARQKKAIDRDAVVDAARQRGWPANRYGINKKLGADFNCTPTHIAGILKSKLNS